MCRCAAAIARAVVAFLDAVLVGCLLSCFRPRHRHHHRRDALVRGDRAAEVLWVDERGLGRSGKSHEDFDGGDIDEEELRQEANYLKLCGTISETPAELQIESYGSNVLNTNECDNMSMNAPTSNCKSVLEANPSEGWEEHHMRRSELKTEDTQHLSGVDSVPPSAFFEKTPIQNLQHNLPEHNVSPFPTPVVLRDDMQTPATICTSHRGASMSGKCVQTRKQFIYPILRPIENRLEHMELTGESSPLPSSNLPKCRNLEADSFKKPKQTSTSVVKSGMSETTSSFSRQVKEALSPDELLDGGELSKTNSDEKNALSLSHWVKSSSEYAENQGDVKGSARGQLYDECIFPTERPVFMASNLDWDIENPTPRLPKTWDGNGIPNTTTKYKEDQRVSWHTTPFEERLLKVLSDGEHCSARKVVRGKLFHLEGKSE